MVCSRFRAEVPFGGQTCGKRDWVEEVSWFCVVWRKHDPGTWCLPGKKIPQVKSDFEKINFENYSINTYIAVVLYSHIFFQSGSFTLIVNLPRVAILRTLIGKRGLCTRPNHPSVFPISHARLMTPDFFLCCDELCCELWECELCCQPVHSSVHSSVVYYVSFVLGDETTDYTWYLECCYW